MDAANLPRLGPIQWAEMGLDFFDDFLPLEGRKLLCLGFSESEIDRFVAPYGPASITSLTYWDGHVDAQSSKYPLIMGDITKPTGLPSQSFDAILTISVLEHLHDLDAGLAEMARLIRPGGAMVHGFGPAWSCPYGHHMYQSPTDDPNFNFSLWGLPAHMHLLCNREEVDRYYEEQGYGPSGGATAWHWFFEAEHINRLFYDDYMRAFAPYRLQRVETMYNDLPPEHLKELRRRYEGRYDFSTYGGRYLMRL